MTQYSWVLAAVMMQISFIVGLVHRSCFRLIGRARSQIKIGVKCKRDQKQDQKKFPVKNRLNQRTSLLLHASNLCRLLSK